MGKLLGILTVRLIAWKDAIKRKIHQRKDKEIEWMVIIPVVWIADLWGIMWLGACEALWIALHELPQAYLLQQDQGKMLTSTLNPSGVESPSHRTEPKVCLFKLL